MFCRIFFIVIFCLFSTPVLSEETSLEQTIKELDQRWLNRDQGSFGTDSLALAKKNLERFPQSYEAHWQYARAAFWACYDSKSLSDAQKEKNCKEGWDAGKRAIEINQSGVEAHYFTALSIGLYAKAVGIVDSVRQGLAGDIEKHAKQAAALDPKYDGAGPHRLLGSYYQNFLGILWFIYGNIIPPQIE